MNLSSALSVDPGDAIAFVGAGGKTSAMFVLAHELEKPVVLTTTTHLGVWQAALADTHLIIRQPEDLSEIESIASGKVLITGPAGEDDRLSGLDADMMATLGQFCQQRSLTLLIEADGARQRPLKAPAEYEPVTPNYVNKVVVMAGLSGLSQPLTNQSVHRPERFSELSNLPVGDKIAVDDLVRVLLAEQGGLKGIPGEASKLLFLNQADDALLTSKGSKIARKLLGIYDRILVGSLHLPGQEGVIFSVHTQTAGVILAAGGSERYGQPKQLLDWAGELFIIRVVKAAIEAELNPIIVITGSSHEKIESVLHDLPVQIVFNPDWQEGQSTSVKKALLALPEHYDGVIFMLSDQPQVSPLLIRSLIESRAKKRSVITAPMAGGQRGNPVLFGKEAFGILETVTGDKGGRAVFNQFHVEWLPWNDPRILLDVDEPGDEETLHIACFHPG